MYGWYGEQVLDACDSPNHFNLRTIGVLENLGHPDFQCCFPAPAQTIMSIFHHIIDDIRTGKRFESNVDYPDYITGGYMLRFMDAIEGDRRVLRMLVPNKDGKYEGGEFAEQLKP